MTCKLRQTMSALTTAGNPIDISDGMRACTFATSQGGNFLALKLCVWSVHEPLKSLKSPTPSEKRQVQCNQSSSSGHHVGTSKIGHQRLTVYNSLPLKHHLNFSRAQNSRLPVERNTNLKQDSLFMQHSKSRNHRTSTQKLPASSTQGVPFDHSPLLSTPRSFSREVRISWYQLFSVVYLGFRTLPTQNGGKRAAPSWGTLHSSPAYFVCLALHQPQALGRPAPAAAARGLGVAVGSQQVHHRLGVHGRPRGGGALCGCGCQNRFGMPFWLVGEFTTHFRLPIFVGIGMFIGGIPPPWPCESYSKPGIQMVVFPEPCKDLRRRLQLFLVGSIPC